MNFFDQIRSFIGKAPFFKKPEKVSFSDLFVHFHQILEGNNATMELMADMEDKLGGQYVFDKKYMQDVVADIEKSVFKSAYDLNFISGNKDLGLYKVIETLARQLKQELAGELIIPGGKHVLALKDVEETLDEAVGNKAYNLFRILNFPQTNVPPSFVVTIGGFHEYLAMNNLHDSIQDLMEDCRIKPDSIDVLSNKIRLLILGGEIPTDLRHEILKAAEDIYPGKLESVSYSVRSSAVGEDGALSFAGLHDSFLNVPFRGLLSSYKKVLAGMYTPGSIRYRIEKKLPFTDMAMAVLFQQMVGSQVAGVAYTVDPGSPQDQSCLIGAGWGLGRSVVEGNTQVDMFHVSRRRPYDIVSSRINEKKWMLSANGSDLPIKVDTALQNISCLSPEQAAAIVETALMIERFFKHPMDIEWALDSDDNLRILQARPLGEICRGGQSRGPELKAFLKKQKILFQDQGVISYRGIGAGPVYIVTDEESLNRFPSGAVLVARFAIPLLASAIPRASAIITDVGSPTGHMATVAREFQIPTIVDTGSATQILEPGHEITVDAEKNIVYDGRITDLLYHQLLECPLFEFRYEFQILRRLLRRISPLTLIDPEGPNFNPKGCKTFHDVIRYIHETSLQTLLTIAEKPAALTGAGGKRLKSNLPLNMILIDIGGGLPESVEKTKWVTPDQILSRPMKDLWAGMDSPDAWNTDPIAPDFKGLMSGVIRTQTESVAGQTLAGLNVAVVGENYLNLTLRVGYHFTVVDAYSGSSPEQNSILFRFVGGATDITRRSRRAALILSILENIGFKVEGSGDLVIARAVNSSAAQIKTYLFLIGRLIGFVRQLDILMKDDTTIELYFNRFMAANNITPTKDLNLKEE